MESSSNLTELLATALWWQGVGQILVFVGVAGELLELIVKANENEKFCNGLKADDSALKVLRWMARLLKPQILLLEAFPVGFIVIGLWVEIVNTGEVNRISAKQNDILNAKAADAWVLAGDVETTNAQLVASNLVLRANVASLELQAASMVRIIDTINPLNLPLSSISAKAILEFGSFRVPDSHIRLLLSQSGDRNLQKINRGWLLCKHLRFSAPHVRRQPRRSCFDNAQHFPLSSRAAQEMACSGVFRYCIWAMIRS